MQSFYDECYRTCIPSLLLHAPANKTNLGENLEVFKHLSEGLKQMGKAAEQSNTLKWEEITLKEREEEKKMDRI